MEMHEQEPCKEGELPIHIQGSSACWKPMSEWVAVGTEDLPCLDFRDFPQCPANHGYALDEQGCLRCIPFDPPSHTVQSLFTPLVYGILAVAVFVVVRRVLTGR